MERCEFLVEREGKLEVSRYIDFVLLCLKGELIELIIFGDELFSY